MGLAYLTLSSSPSKPRGLALLPPRFKTAKMWKGFPGSSAGKESACNAGDPSLTPGSGRSPGERIGYPLQYSWASLVAQIVKNPPAMQKTWVRPLEEGTATHFSIAWRISMDKEAWRTTVHGVAKSQTQLSNKHSTQHRTWKQAKYPPTDEWIKMRYIHMMEY